MTLKELEIKIGNVEDIEMLAQKIKNAADDDAVLEILKAYGLDLGAEDVDGLLKEGELGADALDGVSGGCNHEASLQWVFHYVVNFFSRIIAGHDWCR